MSLRQMIRVVVAFSLLSAAVTAQAQEGKTITEPGQTLTNKEGTWSLSTHGQTKAGYAVTLNGHDVGYAVSLTLAEHSGLPIATHKDGTRWEWNGGTFKPFKSAK